jgi:hypothetical protein
MGRLRPSRLEIATKVFTTATTASGQSSLRKSTQVSIEDDRRRTEGFERPSLFTETKQRNGLGDEDMDYRQL